MKRVPWRSTGLPYWKGIYSASYPVGKMRSTASPTAKLSCGTNSTVPPTVIAVNTTTVMMRASIRVSGVEVATINAAQALLESLGAALAHQWINNAFRPSMTNIRMLGATPDTSGDFVADVLIDNDARKAVSAAQYCIASLDHVLQDMSAQGESS